MISSADFKHTFYGILNKAGEFWTPLAFENERAARRHIEGFWTNDKERAKFLDECSIIPVSIQLTALPPSSGQGYGGVTHKGAFI